MSETDSMPQRENTGPGEQELKSALPQKRRRLEFRVGIFVLIGIATTLTALFLLTDPSTFRGRYRITTVVEDAGGIRRGDPVQMRGVNIGRVMSFSMASEGVRITLEIEGTWAIPEDSRGRLVAGGILGGRTVEIVEGSSSERIRGGAELPGENVRGLLDMPAELGQDAQAVLVQIRSLLAEPTLEAIQGSAVELQGLLERLSRLAAEQGQEIAELTASLSRSASGLEDAAASGEDVARAVARADSALVTVNRTSQVVLSASEALQTILRRIETGEGTLGQLSANPVLYETLVATLESVKALTDDIKANPGNYVKIEIF
ncbi:MAG: MCE family protein [Gemmatimonadetes bacterium]|nr:MCE family protein [Gemmatimonadota bacterium]NNM04148.1 MCE family protein [Gemmatimonadota bacterium]